MGFPPGWYLGLIGLTGLQRLRELQISARNESDTGGERAAAGSYPMMVAAHIALFTLPLIEVSLRRRRPPVALALVGAGVLAAATALRWWSIRSLGPAWNVRAAVPEALRPVTRGPYRWIRHPNYVAVALEFAALPLAGGAWISAILLSALNAGVLALRIPAEERLLERSPEYVALVSGKPRFIPNWAGAPAPAVASRAARTSGAEARD